MNKQLNNKIDSSLLKSDCKIWYALMHGWKLSTECYYGI